MKKIVLASLATLAFTTPALAQQYNGFRVEGRIGYDRIKGEVDYDDGVDQFSGSDHRDGIVVGTEVGYDAQLGGLVLGAYAGAELSTVDVCTEVFGDDKACLDAGRNFTIGVRAGAPVGASTLLYVKGGYTNGKVKLSYDDFVDDLEDFEVSENRGGLHLGGGAEFGLSPNGYGKVEYVYTKYNDYDYDDGDVSGSIGGRRHQVVAGIGFRF